MIGIYIKIIMAININKNNALYSYGTCIWLHVLKLKDSSRPKKIIKHTIK